MITNYISLLGSRIEPSYLTLVCQAGYKSCVKVTSSDYCSSELYKCTSTRVFEQPEEFVLPKRLVSPPLLFTKKENDVNLRRCKKQNFYDARLCRHLCSTTLVLDTKTTADFSKCEMICFELTKTHTAAGQICPFEKYCPNGCPCKHYQCEKLINEQEFIPVWDLNDKKRTSVPIVQEADLIYRRNKGRQHVITKSPALFYDFWEKRHKQIDMADHADTFSSHERF